MARSKPIKTTADALAWIDEQVAAGRMDAPRLVGEGETAVVVYVHECTRCGGGGTYVSLSGWGGVCFGCNGTGTVSKRLAPIEFAKRLRVNLRAKERRATAKQEREDASRAANLARGYGPVTGGELFRAMTEAEGARRLSKVQQRAHVGQVGEHLTMSVVVFSSKAVATRFGTRTVTNMVTDEGHVLTVWGKEPIATGERPRIQFSATVKRHTSWAQEARTELADVEVLALEGHDPVASAEELLVAADYLDTIGGKAFADVERQQLAAGRLPEWVRGLWTDHPATRAAILAQRTAGARRAA